MIYSRKTNSEYLHQTHGKTTFKDLLFWYKQILAMSVVKLEIFCCQIHTE